MYWYIPGIWHVFNHISGIWHIYFDIWHNLYKLYLKYVRYICIIAVTRRLMLRRRTRSHSSRSASNHIAWSYRDCYTLDCTAFASRRFSHVHMRIGSAAEKCWHSSCCTGGTNIPLLRSAVSTMRHCASKEQYDSRVNGKEYTLIASAKLEIWHIYLEYSSIILGISRLGNILDIYQTYLDHFGAWQGGRMARPARRDLIYIIFCITPRICRLVGQCRPAIFRNIFKAMQGF